MDENHISLYDAEFAMAEWRFIMSMNVLWIVVYVIVFLGMAFLVRKSTSQKHFDEMQLLNRGKVFQFLFMLNMMILSLAAIIYIMGNVSMEDSLARYIEPGFFILIVIFLEMIVGIILFIVKDCYFRVNEQNSKYHWLALFVSVCNIPIAISNIAECKMIVDGRLVYFDGALNIMLATLFLCVFVTIMVKKALNKMGDAE